MTNPNAMTQVAEHLPDAPIPPMVGVGAIALQMAMQYHGMNMITDGALYQQYKLEGRNIRTIGLADVFDTAKAIEEHLLRTSDRIAEMVFDSIENAVLSVSEEKDATVPEWVLDKVPEDLQAAAIEFDIMMSQIKAGTFVDTYEVLRVGKERQAAWTIVSAHLQMVVDVAEDDVLKIIELSPYNVPQIIHDHFRTLS